MRNFWIILPCLFLLGACVNREQADEKLAKACVAGAQAFMPENFEVQGTGKAHFDYSQAQGRGFREVSVTVTQSDGWYTEDKEYKCVFAENMAPFGMSHSAEIMALSFDDQFYGRGEDGKLQGAMDDFVKLGKAVKAVLGR